MKVNQIYSLLNDTLAEAFGTSAVNALDVTDVMSLRETVFNGDSDKFLNVLIDRIGKTVIRTLDFTNSFPNLLMEEFEFSAVLQKIDVQPMQAQEQKAWEIGEAGFTPNLFTITKPTVRQGFFRNVSAWEVSVGIPDTMFKTAFTSAEAMDSFITGIFDSMSTSLNMQLEAEERLQIATLIAMKINGSNGVIDLLSLYNNVADTPIYDSAIAMCNKDFLQFAGKIMRNYVKYMAKPSTLYNMGDSDSNTYVRATARDNMHVMLLTEFVSAYDTYVKSVLFNPEDLPLYNEVEYWQGTGTTQPDFATCSAINITLNNDAEHSGANPVTVNQAGVVGLFCDRQTIGVGLYDRFSAVDRNNRNRYSVHTNGCSIQSFIDTSENAVCFIVQDQTEP